MPDKSLVCVDCGSQFVFTAGEQDFYAQKGFTNPPTRCANCRAARKAQRSTGDFGDRGERQMYPAVCAQCGKQTEVPFQPKGDRPVYCSDCFKTQQPARSSSSGGYGGGGGRSSGGGGYGGGAGGRSSGGGGGGRDRDRRGGRSDW